MTLYIAKLQYDVDYDDYMLGIFEKYEDAKNRIIEIATAIKSDFNYQEKLNIYYLENLLFYISTAQLNGTFNPNTEDESIIFSAKIWELVQFTKEELVKILNAELHYEVISYLPYGFFEDEEKIDYKTQDKLINRAANLVLFGGHDEKYMHFNWRIGDLKNLKFYA